MKKTKLITLDQSVIDTLAIQAIKTGFKNCKNYIEHLLITQANEKKANR